MKREEIDVSDDTDAFPFLPSHEGKIAGYKQYQRDCSETKAYV